MKKKLAKQKRRLFITISLCLLALSIVVFGIFATYTYHAKKDVAFYNATLNSSYFENMAMPILQTNRNLLDYEINKNLSENGEIHILNEDGEFILGTRNALPVDFYDTDNMEHSGCIDYEKFKNTFTSEQFTTIKDYLSKETNENGEYYELLCTEFCETLNELIPVQVAIVKTEFSHTWSVEDEIIETFDINPDVLELTIPEEEFVAPLAYSYKQSDMHRNVIDTDFIINNNYQDKNTVSVVEEFFENPDNSNHQNYEDINSTEYYECADRNAINTAPFTFIYYHQTSYVDMIDQFEAKALGIDENIFKIYAVESDNVLSEMPYTYYAIYTEKINILDLCLTEILMMLVYIVVLFLIVGVIIGAMTWRSLKYQITQEERLRTITNAMAHELKSPLFIVSGYSETLIENINTDKREQYANMILSHTKSMNELVCKMLDYSKYDSANINLKVDKINLTELINNILENYVLYGITLECDGDVYINADKKLLTIVIENYLDNAVKYTTEINNIKIKITDKSFEVSNPCNPLTKEEIANLWQPYHRKTEHNNYSGHGLGLAIVKSILDNHKFKCGANYDEGCITFWFHF